MPFCCSLLEHLVSQMGRDGFSAVLKSEMGVAFFCLQARAVDQTRLAALKSEKGSEAAVASATRVVPGLTGRVLLAQQMALTYCPSCGYRLDKWIAENPREAKDLAERSKPFVL